MLARFPLLGARVDLVLLLVFVWGSVRALDEAVVWGLLGGLAVDLLSAGPFGVGVLTLGLVGFLASTLGAELRRTNGLLLVPLVPLATVVANLAAALTLESLGWPVDWPATVALVVLPGCLLNLLALPVVYAFVRAADGWLYVQLRPAS